MCMSAEDNRSRYEQRNGQHSLHVARANVHVRLLTLSAQAALNSSAIIELNKMLSAIKFGRHTIKDKQ